LNKMRSDLKKHVLAVLKDIPASRDNDITLMIEIWKRYHPMLIRKTKDGDLGIYLKDLYRLPREDHVKRYRATIQNVENKYLPTLWSIAKKRKINEAKWRAQLGYKQANLLED